MTTSASEARTGTASLPSGWDAKLPERVKVIPPFYRRSPVRRAAVLVACVIGSTAVPAVIGVARWHRQAVSSLAQERTHLRAFLVSEEFGRFARDTDRYLLATLGFVALNPHQARTALPAVAAFEQDHQLMPWAFEIMPLPRAAMDDPPRLAAACRAASAVLAQREPVWDDDARRAARQVFVHALQPYARAFVMRRPHDDFDALPLDRAMQDEALRALASHYGAGVSVADMERLCRLCGAAGPLMQARLAELDPAKHAPRALALAR